MIDLLVEVVCLENSRFVYVVGYSHRCCCLHRFCVPCILAGFWSTSLAEIHGLIRHLPFFTPPLSSSPFFLLLSLFFSPTFPYFVLVSLFLTSFSPTRRGDRARPGRSGSRSGRVAAPLSATVRDHKHTSFNARQARAGEAALEEVVCALSLSWPM